MNTVIRHIEYLIARKDCVIIPGVGAILATYKNARIDKTNAMLLPPERVYTFNKDIDHNDGMLACSIARAESINYEQACKKMEAGIESMLHILHTDGELAIGRIGVLQFNKLDGTILFDPSVGNLSVCANMWLPALKLGRSKITAVATETTDLYSHINKSPITKNQVSILRRLSRLAASIALVAGICFLATLLPTSQNPEAMKASLAPDFNTTAYEEKNDIVNDTLIIASSHKYKEYSEIDITVYSNNDLSSNYDNNSVAEPTYYIVVAALRSDKEANLYLAQHSGEGLTAMPYKNLYVVYNSTCSDKNGAYKLCCEAVKRYPGAWICSK